MFICNHCPYVKAVLDDIIAEARELQPLGVGAVAIMPNDTEAYPEDSFDNMRRLAQAKAFPFPYLIDRSQQVARAYGAACTPDFFGFDAGRTLRYRGRIYGLPARPFGFPVQPPGNRKPPQVSQRRGRAVCGTLPGPASVRPERAKPGAGVVSQAESRADSDHARALLQGIGFDLRKVKERFPESGKRRHSLDSEFREGEPFLEGVQIKGRLRDLQQVRPELRHRAARVSGLCRL